MLDASMKPAEADDDEHPKLEDENISTHAEMSWYEPLVASNCSFVDRDRDTAAAVALGEAQNGIGHKLVNAAGEITEEAQQAQSLGVNIPSDSEYHTYSNQLLHLAKLGLPLGCLPTQEALSERHIAAREEKNKELQRSYDFLKNAITKYDEAVARVSSTQPSLRTDRCIPDARNKKSENDKKETAVMSELTRSAKKASRKRRPRQSASHAVAKSVRRASKRTRRLARLGLFDDGSCPTSDVLEKAYVRQMQKLKSSEFPSEKRQRRTRKQRKTSRAFRYLMKLRAEEESAM